MSLRRLLTLVCVLVLGAAARIAGAQTVDVIRGRVTGPQNQPIEGALVTVTALSGAVSRQARTDQNGRYTVTFPGGDGDYFVSFASIGWAQRRFEIKRVADEDILVADAKLSQSATQLDAVRVQGARDRATRNDPATDISGTERVINPAALAASQLGDIASMAASLAGVLLVPGADGDPSGFSVLGLSADQNATTLNGQNFSGSDLPRDAAVTSSLVTTPYDVSRGGFSGANFNIRTRPGSNFISRTSSLNIDSPAMQWTDAAARANGQEYSGLSLGGLLMGPIKYNHSFYNFAWQLGRQSNDLQTLLNTDPLGLQSNGLAADSVARLLAILKQLHVPATVGEPLSNRLNDRGSVLGSFDLAPPSSRDGTAYNLTLNGSWNRFSPVSNLTTELPAHSGDRTNLNGGSQLRHSTYFGFGVLSETTVGLNGSHIESSPYLAMPSGSVLINSTFPDGTNGVKTISFGGSPSLNTSTSTSTVSFTNQLSWFSENNKHRVKLTTELREDSYTLDQTTNELGSFAFNSLSDLQAGLPASFTRSLLPRIRSGSQLVGALSLGDSYKATRDLQIQYGVRVDGNDFGDAPTFNPQVEQLYGVRNDYAPNHFYFSPRVGFSWAYGTAPQIGGFEGAFRGPRAVVRGGIGLFQGTPGTQLIGSAVDNTGLSTGLQQVTCVGPAAPTPNWAGYLASQAAIPTQCAPGSTGSVFSSTVPNVTLFAKDYASPRSVRSNLQWTGPVLGNRLSGTFGATYSLNLNQPGFVDLNFNPVSRFTLPDEANRVVYVQPGSVDPGTGFIASGGARQSQLYNHVTENLSDLRSETRQFQATITPFTFSSTYSWTLSYTWQAARERVRGFGNNTAGNPFDLEWARANNDWRHQIQYQLFYNFGDLVRVNWNGRFQSGVPFTPLIQGDVNGDGYSNDRAFVFNPATVRDPALASAMQSLLAGAPVNVKNCLLSQLGQIASRNSCETPWSAQQTNVTISFNPVKVRMPQRATLSFGVNNPLGAADLLLHGENHVHGWGQQPFPDQSLLYVRGFDPVLQRYKYDVNQRFGSTNPLFSPIRTPVTVTAMMRFDIGPTREEQSLTQQLNLGRRTEGNKLPEALLRAIYANGGLVNPMANILRQTDTLGLTSKQADSLATLNRWYVIRLDSVWSPVARNLAALPDRFDEGEAYREYKHAREGTVDLLKKIAPKISGLLTAEQRRKLPAIVTSYMDQRYLSAIRSGTAGAGGSGLFPGGQIAMPAGGSQQVVIIH